MTPVEKITVATLTFIVVVLLGCRGADGETDQLIAQPSDLEIRTLIRNAVRRGDVGMRWRKIGDQEWRCDLPGDSVDIVFEVNRPQSEAAIFERQYDREHIMAHDWVGETK